MGFLQPVPRVDCLALAEEAQGGNTEAVTALEDIVRVHGPELPAEELCALARIDARAGTAALLTAVEQTMRHRGLWRDFRRRERWRLVRSAARWSVALLALGAGLLAAVFFIVAGGSHVLHWMGF